MTEMPKEIWAADVQYEGARRLTWRRTPGPGQSTRYVRADIADGMLEALERIASATEPGRMTYGGAIHGWAEAAIAKAKSDVA